MDEVKTPKRPIVTFYIIAMILLLILNLIAVPLYQNRQVKLTDYGTFMKMTQEKKIGKVEITERKTSESKMIKLDELKKEMK